MLKAFKNWLLKTEIRMHSRQRGSHSLFLSVKIEKDGGVQERYLLQDRESKMNCVVRREK